MGSRSAPNFCSRCGASLSPDDAFCSQCGSSVGDSNSGGRGGAGGRGDAGGRGGSGLGGDDGRGGLGSLGDDSGRGGGGRADRSTDFRRRIENLTAEGWEVEHDYGDRVVMVDRGFGSWGVHGLLLLFTGGLGNIPYAWYCYSTQPDRIELYADGRDRYVSADEESDSDDIDAPETTAGNVVLSFFAALIGFGILSGVASLPAFFVGVSSLLLALYALPPIRERVHDRESVDTFGTVRSTDETVVEAPDTPCTACSRPVDTGVKRTFHETYYLAGLPISREEKGENHYCRSCAQGDPFTENDVESDEPETAFEF